MITCSTVSCPAEEAGRLCRQQRNCWFLLLWWHTVWGKARPPSDKKRVKSSDFRLDPQSGNWPQPFRQLPTGKRHWPHWFPIGWIGWPLWRFFPLAGFGIDNDFAVIQNDINRVYRDISAVAGSSLYRVWPWEGGAFGLVQIKGTETVEQVASVCYVQRLFQAGKVLLILPQRMIGAFFSTCLILSRWKWGEDRIEKVKNSIIFAGL